MMSIEELRPLVAHAPLAPGYRFEVLQRTEVFPLVRAIANWFPDIAVGGASCYLRKRYYDRKAYFADAASRDLLVVVLKREDEIAGMFACELDRDTQSVYASLGVAAPNHRGTNLAQAGMALTEVIAHRLGVGFVYGHATMKNPYAQRAFERAGWRLIGIMPGYDREVVAPGVIKRVYEAVYAKVLAADAGVSLPDRENLTPLTRSFFDWIFAGCQGMTEKQAETAG
jgi:Acetyltransferase (GNAT) family